MSVAGLHEENSAEVVVDSFRDTPDERLKTVLSSLVEHLHAFIRDVEPTHAEWERGVEFLTAVGHMCDATRQEFVLLSDVLGVSMLVDVINNRRSESATDTTVLGPFHMVPSPARDLGANISLDAVGEPCVFAGQVRSVGGDPLAGARVDVWQANGAGFYDVQHPMCSPNATSAACSSRTTKAGSGCRRWSRGTTRSPTMVPWADCWQPQSAIPTGRPTST